MSGSSTKVRIKDLDCGDPAAIYIVTEDGLVAICEDWEVEFTYTPSVGLMNTTCLDYNLAVGECLTYSDDINVSPDVKVDCAATVGAPNTLKVLFNSTDSFDETQCPAETTLVNSSLLRNTLRCYGTN